MSEGILGVKGAYNPEKLKSDLKKSIDRINCASEIDNNKKAQFVGNLVMLMNAPDLRASEGALYDLSFALGVIEGIDHVHSSNREDYMHAVIEAMKNPNEYGYIMTDDGFQALISQYKNSRAA